MKRAVLLFFLLIPFVAADQFIFDDSLYSAKHLEAQISVSSSLTYTADPSRVEATLLYFPVDIDGQDLLEVSYLPQPKETGSVVRWIWDNPGDSVSFAHNSVVESFFHRPAITERIEYPFEVPQQYTVYLQSSDIIQVTDDVAAQASSIVGSETDAVRIAFLLGMWVKENIEYDLNSVAEDASQTSQWVLDNRFGVCDELTSLFIAMLRSQGIPARFVSGVAYTNLEGLESPWGPHGWAEVYFPEVGWVPYDVTYGQFGFVDATHIAFGTSVDAQANAVEYSMRSSGGELLPQELQRDVELLSKSGERQEDVNFSASVAVPSVGFGSSNRIDVSVTNTQPYYVSTELYIGQTTQVKIDRLSQPVLLEPFETREFSFFVTISDDLQNGFVYTFPFIIYTNTNQNTSTQFVSREGIRTYTQRDLGKTTLPTSTSLIECSYPASVQVNEPATITCTNTGSKICIDEQCAQDTLTLTEVYEQAGAYTYTTTSDDSRRVITVLATDLPAISIEVQAPPTVNFGKPVPLNITVNPASQSIAEDIVVTISHPLFIQEFSVASLSRSQSVEVPIPSEYLLHKPNTFTITSNYEAQSSVTVQVQPQRLSQRVRLRINSLSAWLQQL